jgi:hypothetical protein
MALLFGPTPTPRFPSFLPDTFLGQHGEPHPNPLHCGGAGADAGRRASCASVSPPLHCDGEGAGGEAPQKVSGKERFPSGRYVHTDPLRREFGLRLLTETLPEPLRTILIRAWRKPRRYDGNQAIQSLHRQRAPEASFPFLPPARLVWIALIELEVSRRVVETSRTEIKREERNALLAGQGAYLCCLYAALVAQLGEAAALAEFQRLITGIG